MEALRAPSPVHPPTLLTSRSFKLVSTLSFSPKSTNSPLTQSKSPKFNNFTTVSSSVSSESTSVPETETKSFDQDEQFDWFSQWYALMPVCDLDKRAPIGKKLLGLDVVVWFDKNENAWKVFDDMCPHRLAPLSEGRIDEWGRLQCVYHGWCFNGSGNCKLIPQAPIDGPSVHTFKKACVAVYPSTVQNGIIWLWPNTDPQYNNIITKKKPPYIPELDDPSSRFQMFNRDIPYGYEILIENLMDPAHVPYAHYGIIRPPQPSVKQDREGGRPLEINVHKIDKNGFTAQQENGSWNFVPPCLFYGSITIGGNPNESDGSTKEKKLMEADPCDWQKLCFVPTKSDANVVAFRKWLKKYSGGQLNWGNRFDRSLPPSPPREQLMDRYWTHVVNCSSCNAAYKGLSALEVSLHVFSVASVAIVAATKQGVISVAARNTLLVVAILCFVGSKWLSHFIYKNFRFHDYNHAFR